MKKRTFNSIDEFLYRVDDFVDEFCYHQYLEDHPDVSMSFEEYLEDREKHRYDIYNYLVSLKQREKESENTQ